MAGDSPRRRLGLRYWRAIGVVTLVLFIAAAVEGVLDGVAEWGAVLLGRSQPVTPAGRPEIGLCGPKKRATAGGAAVSGCSGHFHQIADPAQQRPELPATGDSLGGVSAVS